MREKRLKQKGSAELKTAPAALVGRHLFLIEGGAKYDPMNLQALCARCHYRKTMADLKRTRSSPAAGGRGASISRALSVPTVSGKNSRGASCGFSEEN